MISKYTYKGLTWIDLESPSEEELTHVMEEYSIPVLVGEELRTASSRSKIDLYPTFLFLVLNFPQITHKKTKSVEQEIDFVIGNDFIITTHYEFIDSLHEFSKMFEVDAILEKNADIDHAGYLFFHLIKMLYKHARYELNEVNLLLKEAEKKVFSGRENRMVAMISDINRMLLDFKQALRFHKGVLNSFETSGKQFFGEKFGYYISAIINEYNKTQAILDSHKEILDDLRDTNDSLLASKTSETMRVLTAVTVLISPITIVSSIFVMNTDFVRITDRTDFYIVLGSMIGGCILIFIYFRAKKWL